jgi:hypothetical protein
MHLHLTSFECKTEKHGKRVKYIFTYLFYVYKLREITGRLMQCGRELINMSTSMYVGLTSMIDKQDN